eukprot:SAG22_NODE_20092_length_268_cov_1.514793_1_plen_45_part_10
MSFAAARGASALPAEPVEGRAAGREAEDGEQGGASGKFSAVRRSG